MKKQNLYFFIFIFSTSLTLVSLNYFTISTLSAVRAYITGESAYSKGQKDANIYLCTYIDTKDPEYLKYFHESIDVPIADNMARASLERHESKSIVTYYFLKGKNHPEDIPDMIWLYKTFRTNFMKKPIKLWTEAEPLINQLYAAGMQIQKKIENNQLTEEDKIAEIKYISGLSAQLYEKESGFSYELGIVARKINFYLLLADIVCVIIIVGNITLYVLLMLSSLKAAYKKTEDNNKLLVETNKELDTFLYSISHDLRSPITSMKGLIALVAEEDELSKIQQYAGIMSEVIEKQDAFILEIIDFFRHKRSSLSYSEFSLQTLVGQAVTNNKYAPLARNIRIQQKINLDTITTDELRLKMIINNLISNAIKYSDPEKPEKTISILTEQVSNHALICVEDNGIGMDQPTLNKIFDLFFVAGSRQNGTGLGLYILKHNVEKLQGRIEVVSERKIGTKFMVYIPVSPRNASSN